MDMAVVSAAMINVLLKCCLLLVMVIKEFFQRNKLAESTCECSHVHCTIMTRKYLVAYESLGELNLMFKEYH